MSVLIKGVSKSQLVQSTYFLPDDIETIEVPTPHGNLVDIDAMIDRFWDGDHMEIHCRDLDDIPIIVEAEAEHE